MSQFLWCSRFLCLDVRFQPEKAELVDESFVNSFLGEHFQSANKAVSGKVSTTQPSGKELRCDSDATRTTSPTAKFLFGCTHFCLRCMRGRYFRLYLTLCLLPSTTGLVQHQNIDLSCVNGHKLHLNRKGIAK